MKASISYTIFTPESTEHGLSHDFGMYQPGGWHYSMLDDDAKQDILNNPENYELSSLGEAIHHANQLGCTAGAVHNNTITLFSREPVQNFTTGEDAYYTVTISEVSAGSTERIKNYLESNGVTF